MTWADTKSHFKVRSVQGIPGLKYNQFPPTHFTKRNRKMSGSGSQVENSHVLRQFQASPAAMKPDLLAPKGNLRRVLILAGPLTLEAQASVRSTDVLHLCAPQHDPILTRKAILLPGQSAAKASQKSSTTGIGQSVQSCKRASTQTRSYPLHQIPAYS